MRKPGISNEIYLPGEPVITPMSSIQIKMIVSLAQHSDQSHKKQPVACEELTNNWINKIIFYTFLLICGFNIKE